MIKLHKMDRTLQDLPPQYMLVLQGGEPPLPSLLISVEEAHSLIAQLALELHYRLD